jgi:hypothetical protein
MFNGSTNLDNQVSKTNDKTEAMETNTEQRPFGDAVFAENPENRCPVLLLLDNWLNAGGTRLQS